MQSSSENSTLIPRFAWDEQRTKAAISLASGATKQEAADDADVDRTTIYNWLHHPDFAAEVDRLSLMIGIASRAERLRLAMRVIRTKIKDGIPQSDKDILEWLKFAQSETDGVILKLTSTVTEAEASLAGGRSEGVEPEVRSGTVN